MSAIAFGLDRIVSAVGNMTVPLAQMDIQRFFWVTVLTATVVAVSVCLIRSAMARDSFWSYLPIVTLGVLGVVGVVVSTVWAVDIASALTRHRDYVMGCAVGVGLGSIGFAVHAWFLVRRSRDARFSAASACGFAIVATVLAMCVISS